MMVREGRVLVGFVGFFFLFDMVIWSFLGEFSNFFCGVFLDGKDENRTHVRV